MDQYYGTNAPSSTESDAARIAELVRIQGYAELPGLLTPEQVHEYSERLDAVYDEQRAEFAEASLESIGEANVVRFPLAYDSKFLELIRQPTTLDVVRTVLGDYFILHLQNGIIVHPQRTHHQSAWHRDLPYQEFVSSKPLAVNVFYCLEDFNHQTGGTMFLPFSHRQEQLPSKEVLGSIQAQPSIQSGSAVIFDSMLFHRAGDNSSDRIRRGVNHVFTTGILRQQIDLPGWLPRQNPEIDQRASADPELRRILGYDARTAESVRAFRLRRLERVKSQAS